MDERTTPPARHLLEQIARDQHERDTQVGELRGEVRSLQRHMERIDDRLATMPTRDELYDGLDRIVAHLPPTPSGPDSSPQDASKTVIPVILPWLLSGLGLAATAVAAWFAAG